MLPPNHELLIDNFCRIITIRFDVDTLFYDGIGTDLMRICEIWIVQGLTQYRGSCRLCTCTAPSDVGSWLPKLHTLTDSCGASHRRGLEDLTPDLAEVSRTIARDRSEVQPDPALCRDIMDDRLCGVEVASDHRVEACTGRSGWKLDRYERQEADTRLKHKSWFLPAKLSRIFLI